MSSTIIISRAYSSHTRTATTEYDNSSSYTIVSTESSKAYYDDSSPCSNVSQTNAHAPIGYVPGMPGPNWFTSGASRDERERRKWSLPELTGGLILREGSMFDRFAGVPRRSTDKGHEQREEVVEDEEDVDCEAEVSLKHSVSQVGLSGAGGGGRAGAGNSSAEFCRSEVVWFDEAIGSWTKNVSPIWAR